MRLLTRLLTRPTMKELCFALIALVAVSAANPLLKDVLPTKCPAKDSMHKTVLLPHEYDCTLYYACNGGQKIAMRCAPYKDETGHLYVLHYNHKEQACDWPGQADCKLMTCPKDAAGKVIKEAHESDCTKYYDCLRDQRDLRTCAPGEDFHRTKLQCVKKAASDCNKKDTMCPGFESTRLPHGTNCAQYYQCRNGEASLKTCPNKLLYNPATNECDDAENVDCDGGGSNECPKGVTKRIPHESDCTKYYLCKNGIKTTRICGEGLHFNAETEDCDNPESAGCDEGTGTEGCPAKGNTRVPNPKDCASYYRCNDGKGTLVECGDGLHFNAKSKDCDNPEDAGCGAKIANGCPAKGYDRIPHKTLCGSYYTCQDGKATLVKCGKDLHFNKKTKECDTIEAAGCEKPKPGVKCPATGTSRLPHETDCTRYYRCNSGKATLVTCGKDLHYNKKTQECDTIEAAGCEKPKPGVKCPATGISRLPHETDCTRYYRCNSGKATLVTCGKDLHYNKKTQECDTIEAAGCEKPKPGVKCPATGQSRLPHATDCTRYYRCNSGKATLVTCGKDLHYNKKTQDCDQPEDAGCKGDVSKSPCPPTGSDRVPHESDCNSYYRCNNGKATLVHCREGLHFNKKKQDCDNPATAGCETTKVCPDKGYARVPHKSDCASFYECKNGKELLRQCSSGLHFNRKTGDCDNPAAAGCTGTGCTGNKKEPHENECGKYYQCVNGKRLLLPCPAGKHFSVTKQTCLDPPEAGCDPTARECEGTFKNQHETDCGKYYICKNGRKVLQSCPTGKHFSVFRQSCLNPEDAYCEGTYTPLPEPTTPDDKECEGKFLAEHETACDKYYSCENGKRIVKTCPKGEQFNVYKQNCVDKENAHCGLTTTPTPTDEPTVKPPVTKPPPAKRPRTCPPLGSKEQVKLPHECQCDLYYNCQNGKQIRMSCEPGKHFDYVRQVCDAEALVNCVRPIPEDSDSVCTAPTKRHAPVLAAVTAADTCPENGIVRMPYQGKCSLYYECKHGQKRVLECHRGLYFDSIKQVCVLPHKADCTEEDKEDPANTTPAPSTCSTDEKETPHECCCSNYYTCEKGQRVLQRCPGSFQFDQHTKGCDMPHLVKCVNSIPDIDANYNIANDSKADPADDPATCIGTCPDENSSDHTDLLPNEDCAKYCSCSWGIPTVMHCPPGLHFSPKHNSCVWPRDAKCKPRTPGKLDEPSSNLPEAKASIWANIPILNNFFP